jgi:uncharacterized protein (DUF1330 family)
VSGWLLPTWDWSRTLGTVVVPQFKIAVRISANSAGGGPRGRCISDVRQQLSVADPLRTHQEGEMAAYMIAEHKITDAAKFEEYRTKVGPMIAKHGGRYLTKGGNHKVLENGHWQPDRVVIIEFPDMAALNAWYSSPEYQPLITLRQGSTSDLDMLITLEGA